MACCCCSFAKSCPALHDPMDCDKALKTVQSTAHPYCCLEAAVIPHSQLRSGCVQKCAAFAGLREPSRHLPFLTPIEATCSESPQKGGWGGGIPHSELRPGCVQAHAVFMGLRQLLSGGWGGEASVGFNCGNRTLADKKPPTVSPNVKVGGL